MAAPAFGQPLGEHEPAVKAVHLHTGNGTVPELEDGPEIAHGSGRQRAGLSHAFGDLWVVGIAEAFQHFPADLAISFRITYLQAQWRAVIPDPMVIGFQLKQPVPVGGGLFPFALHDMGKPSFHPVLDAAGTEITQIDFDL